MKHKIVDLFKLVYGTIWDDVVLDDDVLEDDVRDLVPQRLTEKTHFMTL